MSGSEKLFARQFFLKTKIVFWSIETDDFFLKINYRVIVDLHHHCALFIPAVLCFPNLHHLSMIHFTGVFLIYWNLKLQKWNQACMLFVCLRLPQCSVSWSKDFRKLEQSVRAPGTWQELPLKWLQLKANAALLLCLKKKTPLSMFHLVREEGGFTDNNGCSVVELLLRFEKQVLDSNSLLRVDLMKRQGQILKTHV